MLDRLKARYRRLPDRWKAALRTAWQTVLAAIALFLLSMVNAFREVLAGGNVDLMDAATDSSRILGDAVLVVIAGLIALVMNRDGGARYPGGDR